MTRSSPRRRNVDLAVPRWPVNGQNGRDNQLDLAELYDWAERCGRDALDWYLSEKERKARWSKVLRASSIVLATLGGVVPVVALATGQAAFGNWGFIILALAAGCLAYDRYFGYSSAWQRYMKTATTLRVHLSEFQMAWLKEMVVLRGRPDPPTEDTVRLVELIRQFIGTVNDIIRSETETWLTEFTQHLTDAEARLPHSARGRADASSL
jgi:hypothetical protein